MRASHKPAKNLCTGQKPDHFAAYPWRSTMQAENKFKCPCHGSQYDNTGKVVRGPAPLVSRWSRASSPSGGSSV